MLRTATLPFLLSLVFALLFLPQGTLLAATPKKEPLAPVALDGDTYTVNFPTEKTKPKDKLVFGEKELTVGSLGELKIPYTAKRKGSKATSETEFSGTVTDAKGTVIEVTGKVTDGGELHGSITTRPKDQDPTARNFNGTKTGEKKKDAAKK